MPELEIIIGGRSFQVACQPGEEHFLRAAAQMLDAEAAPMVGQLGRLPESKMLLMAGLMLADKTAALEDETRSLKARLAAMEARAAQGADPVEVVPPQLVDSLATLAARAEALAARMEARN